jgi:hypothetical protein
MSELKRGMWHKNDEKIECGSRWNTFLMASAIFVTEYFTHYYYRMPLGRAQGYGTDTHAYRSHATCAPLRMYN